MKTNLFALFVRPQRDLKDQEVYWVGFKHLTHSFLVVGLNPPHGILWYSQVACPNSSLAFQMGVNPKIDFIHQ